MVPMEECKVNTCNQSCIHVSKTLKQIVENWKKIVWSRKFDYTEKLYNDKLDVHRIFLRKN
jgi:hypothetical protein